MYDDMWKSFIIKAVGDIKRNFGKNVIHNKERISQVKIIFKQKSYLEIAGHVGELNRSKK